VGDLFKVTDAEFVNSRSGREQPELMLNDLLLRLRHSGDCFCYYAIIRDGRRLAEEWAGYDVPEFIRNVVDDVGRTYRGPW